MSLFKKANELFNEKIWYPLFSRIYWNFSVVDTFHSDVAIIRKKKSSSDVYTEVIPKGEAKLMRCRFPNGEFISYLAKKYKLKSILSLEDDYDKDIDTICAKFNINHIKSLDHVSAKTIFQDKKDLDLYLKIINDISNYPMVIRCRAGADRTGVACALYRIEKQNWNNLRAFLEMLTFFHAFFKFPWCRKFIMNYEKE